MNNVTDLTVPVRSHTHRVCITQLSSWPRPLKLKTPLQNLAHESFVHCLSHLFSTFPCYVLREDKEFFSVCNYSDMLTQQQFYH